jgi:hypothetical protein
MQWAETSEEPACRFKMASLRLSARTKDSVFLTVDVPVPCCTRFGLLLVLHHCRTATTKGLVSS